MTDESYQNARCILMVDGSGEWWCPRHGGPPSMTLDTYPPYCADCYTEITKARGEYGCIISWDPVTRERKNLGRMKL